MAKKYIALREVGGFTPGQEVPEEKALIWLQMYGNPHVKEEDAEHKSDPSPSNLPVQPAQKEVIVASPLIFSSLLKQDEKEVLTAILKDKFSKDQFRIMLDEEKKGKNRAGLISNIQRLLKR